MCKFKLKCDTKMILLQTRMHEKLRSSGRKYTKKRGERKEINPYLTNVENRVSS